MGSRILRRSAVSRASLSLALAFAATGAQAERVCVEEVSGVCLKYKTIENDPPKAAAPAPQVSQAELNERALGLSRDDRRAAQRGLQAAGAYRGAIDGLFGGGTRRAVADWQRANGFAATGFLSAETFSRLKKLAAAAPAAPSSGAAQTSAGATSGSTGQGDIGAIVNNLFCVSIIDGFDAKVTFRGDGGARALTEDATLRVTWKYRDGDFCIFSSGLEVRCIPVGQPPVMANKEQIRSIIRRGC